MVPCTGITPINV